MRDDEKALTAWPKLVRERVWKIEPYDRRVVYSTRMASKHVITVLANGRDVVWRGRVKSDLDLYCIQGRWLERHTSPRAAENLRRGELARAALRAERAAAWRMLKASPRYRRFIADATKLCGPPRAAVAMKRSQLAFRAPASDAQADALVAQARAAGAHATVFLASWGREIRVAETCDSIVELFEYMTWKMGPHLTALGATFPFIADLSWYELDLARKLPRPSKQLVEDLAEGLRAEPDEIRDMLRDGGWHCGPERSAWKRRGRAIHDPGTVPD